VIYKKRFKFLIIFYILLCAFPIQANEKVYYLDLNFLMNNSLAGKSLSKKLKNKNEKNIVTFKKIEKDLVEEESKIIAQKNILNDDEFNKKIVSFKKKVSDFNNKKKKAISDFSNYKIEAETLLFKALTPILGDYVEKNSIAVLLDKKNIIIAKSELDLTSIIIKILDTKVKEIKIK